MPSAPDLFGARTCARIAATADRRGYLVPDAHTLQHAGIRNRLEAAYRSRALEAQLLSVTQMNQSFCPLSLVAPSADVSTTQLDLPLFIAPVGT